MVGFRDPGSLMHVVCWCVFVAFWGVVYMRSSGCHIYPDCVVAVQAPLQDLAFFGPALVAQEGRNVCFDVHLQICCCSLSLEANPVPHLVQDVRSFAMHALTHKSCLNQVVCLK